MGPVGGTYLLVLLLVLGGLASLTWLLRPQLKRAGRYFINWMERDRRAEEEARQLQIQRQQAEKEVQHYLHEEEEIQEQQPLQRQ
jgi:predicted PurR-regulated permease PerM